MMNKMYKVSFFSYKGGSGRSTALINTIPFLAKELNATDEHPILLVDMDLDSTGLTYLLKQSEKYDLTIQDVLIDGVPGGNDGDSRIDEHPFFSRLAKVGRYFNREDAAVLLLPARPGKTTGKDGTNKNMTSDCISHMKKLKKLCDSYECRAIVFDSSAGDQETANASNIISDIIVCCMRPTTQFQEGTIGYFLRVGNMIRERNIIILPNAVSRENVRVDGFEYPMTARNEINDNFTERLKETGNIIHMDALAASRFGVPLVKRFLWKETILASLNQDALKDDEKEAIEMYKNIAKWIVEKGE